MSDMHHSLDTLASVCTITCTQHNNCYLGCWAALMSNPGGRKIKIRLKEIESNKLENNCVRDTQSFHFHCQASKTHDVFNCLWISTPVIFLDSNLRDESAPEILRFLPQQHYSLHSSSGVNLPTQSEHISWKHKNVDNPPVYVD